LLNKHKQSKFILTAEIFDRFLTGALSMKKHLLALALVAATGAAQADVITQSDAFGFATTNWTHTLGALSQFDSTLGP
jgi:nucleoside-specific outer membrane channel protein Tsx